MKKGFSLIEAVMSLALFIILSSGVFFLWQHVARNAAETIRVQRALDNLGLAMDALTKNIEFSRRMVLQTNSQNVLLRLELYGYYWDGSPDHPYVFTFSPHAIPGTPRYKSLFFGGRLGQQQHSYGIKTIRIINVDYLRLDITIVSACEYPITINGSVNIQHKHMTVR